MAETRIQTHTSSEPAPTSGTAPDSPAERIRAFVDSIFPPPRNFALRLWDGAVLPAAGEPKFTLVLSSPGTLRRMFRPPIEMNMGEAFLRRDFDIEGDVCDAFELVARARAGLSSPGDLLALARRWRALPKDRAGDAAVRERRARLSGERHSKNRDRAAIQYHYDTGNEFYRLFLDRRMQYSAGHFERSDEDLDAAQEHKLSRICTALGLEGGDELLDIGCGWGGLAIYAAERCGARVTGVTLSEAQKQFADERITRAGLEDRVRIELRDYRDLEGTRFDKIVSVGMFEHVGRDHLSEYFRHAFRLLEPGGRFMNRGISTGPGTHRRRERSAAAKLLARVMIGSKFRERYIFPDGELIPVSETNRIAERAGFEIRDFANYREHYARTLRRWVTRLEQHRDEAIRRADETTYRLWILYMAASCYHFERGLLTLGQTLLEKPAGASRA